MKPKQLVFLLIFAALVLSACNQVSQAAQDQNRSINHNPNLSENAAENEPAQDVQNQSPQDPDATRLLVNMISGYCLRYPVEYDLAFVNVNRVMFFKGSYMSTSEPNSYIEVQLAEGVTVEQAADKVAAIFGIPGEDLQKVDLLIGGEKAILLEGLSGQDPNRQVVVIHQDSLYTLYFLEVNKEQAEVYTQAEVLYNALINTLNFATDPLSCAD